jgi:hypothetical protein
MIFTSWEQVCAVLEHQVAEITPEQRRLAETLGVTLRDSEPARVAAERLTRALSEPLCVPPSRAPSARQLAFLDDLSHQWPDGDVCNVTTSGEASAWIDVLTTRRVIAALTRLKLQAGDLVAKDGRRDEPETVASIGSDGFVYFQGGGGQRSQPHRLEVLARAVDMSAEADGLRNQARNRQARRRRLTRPPSTDLIEKYRVDNPAGRSEALMLADLVDGATDERPLQQVITENPGILAALVRGSSYGTFVLPWPRLGGDFVPDFLVAHTDSIGINWTMVELESPSVVPFLQDGRPSGPLRNAIQQIHDWHSWLRNNLDAAQRARSEYGIGLPGIREDAAGLILIGRRGDPPVKYNDERQRLQVDSQILVHSYDWLIDVLRRPFDPVRPPMDQPLGYPSGT